MIKFLSGLGGLIISLVLFMGFGVINLASADGSDQYIGATAAAFFKANKLWLYVLVGALFVSQQVWLLRRHPATKAEVEEVEHIVQPLFPSLVRDYYQTIKSLQPSSTHPAPAIRLNVMLPTWRRLRWGQYLKIYYWYGGVMGVRYPDSELDLKWAAGQGTCGFA
jgi:hypothetical protein